MTAISTKTAGWPRWINLLVPGGGLILIGNGFSGVLIAVLFTLSTSFALAAILLFPDDVPRTWRGLALGIAVGTYLGAQWRYAQTVRYRADQAFWDVRKETVRQARQALLEGRGAEAWDILQPLKNDVEVDLALAYLVAQVLTQTGDESGARTAWRRVKRLDRHRIYRREIREYEERTSAGVGTAERSGKTESASS